MSRATKMNEDDVIELITYLGFDETAGKVYWKIIPSRVQDKVGQQPGYTNVKGYTWIWLHSKYVSITTVLWFLYYGSLPSEGFIIDHRDGNPKNDKKDNLRLATPLQNSMSKRRKKGYKGVYIKNGRYCAMCKNKHLGMFDTKQEALDAYDKAAIKEFGEFALTNAELARL